MHSRSAWPGASSGRCRVILGDSPRDIPVSVEVSPGTADPEKLARLRQFGASSRESGGADVRSPGGSGARSAAAAGTCGAGSAKAPRGQFPHLEHRSDVWHSRADAGKLAGIAPAALAWRPEEVFLYPLYVRPLTGLAIQAGPRDDLRMAAYRAGRDLLLAEGYAQVRCGCSARPMRRRRKRTALSLPGRRHGRAGLRGPLLHPRLHYSTQYAVSGDRIREIIKRFAARPAESFDWADYGFRLDLEDQRRRYVLLGLLECEGLDLATYAARFGCRSAGRLAGTPCPGGAQIDGGRP